jgi:membrane protease YdiL (CAAX protease family)
MRGIPSVPASMRSQALEAVAPSSRHWQYGLQLAIALILLEGALWSSGVTQVFCFWSTVAWIVLTTRMPARSGADLGLCLKGIRGMSWLLCLSLGCATAAIWIAWQRGDLHPAFGPATRPWHYLAYAGWALLQQFMLQSYFFLRLERMLSSSWRAVIGCAVLFSFVHLPNSFLALTTLAGGLVFCELFRRYRNIYPLGLAHAALGICIAVTVSSDLHHHMRVGRGFYDDPSSNGNLSSFFYGGAKHDLHTTDQALQ